MIGLQRGRQDASQLLLDLIRLEVEIVHQSNSNRGVSKSNMKRERKLVTEIFNAMSGEDITEEELNAICE